MKIISIYDEVQCLCADYLTDGTPEFSVKTTHQDIDFERLKSASEDKKEGRFVRIFSDSYLETLAVYRKIAFNMIDYDTLLFHGSVIAVDGEGYLFTAKSGTGKSTHTRLWRELFGSRAVMVNDDKPLLKITENGVVAYGTPWDGKHRLSCNTSVLLKGLCILTRDRENHIERIDGRQAYGILMQQTYRPYNKEKLLKTLQLVDRIVKTVNLYKLGCNMDIEAAKVAYEGMNGR